MGVLTGAVTFLFTDIEGSTRLVKALRERYPAVLAEHRRLVRAAIAANGGHEVDTQGDAFFAAFGGAKQAVLCALEVQRSLAAHDWPEGARVRVRIGIHTGQAVPSGDGYAGLAVHRAARICAVAAGGQVLVSQATQTLIEDEEEDEDLGFTLVDAGEHQLKDLDRPVRLFQPVAGARSGDADPGAAGDAAGVHGLAPPLTSFVGRVDAVPDVAGLLAEHRLVTVTGPGGSGKTRLAGEVAKHVADRFADGVWLAELAPVADAAQVASVVAAALGIPEHPGVPPAEAVARVLARQQVLLVLDNCEHVIGAAAELCAALLAAADDLRILATSREPLTVAEESCYRLAPLAVPDPDDLADAAGAEAVALFTDRARLMLTAETAPSVSRLVRRLDGMPLAIELAAARAEALGVTQLLERLDRFSLAGTVEWSYQLLDETGRRVFRALSVFPGPFTLEAAEAVAGPEARTAVPYLADCSLLVPPRPGLDGRSRYGMLETLRAYGTERLTEAGGQDAAEAALAIWALRVAEEAAAGLQTTSGEPAAARWLDAEDVTMRQVLAWATDHDARIALRLAAALGQWWFLRGRAIGRYPVLRAAAARGDAGSDEWCTAQCWLGYMAAFSAGWGPRSLEHFTASRDAAEHRGPSRALADALVGRSQSMSGMRQTIQAAGEARRALAVAREAEYPAAKALALTVLSRCAADGGDLKGAVRLARMAEQIPADICGWNARWTSYNLAFILDRAGDPAAARDACAAGLDRCREVGDLWTREILLSLMPVLDLRADCIKEAAAHLEEELRLTARLGARTGQLRSLDGCAQLCAATGRPAEAVTLWACHATLSRREEQTEAPATVRRRKQAWHDARQALGPDRTRGAEDRGAAMSLGTAAEYALMLTAPATQQPRARAGLGNLSGWDRELVTLVAQGRTNAQIAAQLHLSASTVGSHLDRIRTMTGARRRADLTRLALQAGLV